MYNSVNLPTLCRSAHEVYDPSSHQVLQSSLVNNVEKGYIYRDNLSTSKWRYNNAILCYRRIAPLHFQVTVRVSRSNSMINGEKTKKNSFSKHSK